jgi:hypothetical protein
MQLRAERRHAMATTTVENQLIDLEKQFWQAMKDKDAETAMRLTDDTCILTGPQGVSRVEREAVAGMINSTDYDLKDFDLKDTQVQLLSDDVAIVAYQAHEELTVNGEPVTLDVADSSTWVRRDGKWVCALHTEAIAGDPYGRDRKSA